jgi:uncharacterized protein YciI
MFYLVIRHDKPDAETLRDELKIPHRKFLSSLGKSLLTGGAIFDDNGKVIGGSITFEAPTLAEAHRIAQLDPYAQHPEIGFKTTIIPFRVRWKDGEFHDGDGFSLLPLKSPTF